METMKRERKERRPPWQRAVWGAYMILLLSISAFRIVDTYSVLSHTRDEPAHLAAGMELLDRGTYTYEQQHPPLARVAAALGALSLGITR